MKKNDHLYLKDMLIAINEIEDFVAGINFEIFSTTKIIEKAVVKNIEIIGEAANHLSGDFTKDHSNLDASEAISMRNFLIHQYGDIDYKIIWDTIKNDLPLLKKQVKKILDK